MVDPTLGDISDLPAQLRNELRAEPKRNALDDAIVSVIRQLGEPCSVDHVLVGLYRSFGIVQKRLFIQNRLYRMTRKGLLSPASGRKKSYIVGGSNA